MTHSLVVSDDGGRRWRDYCALPRGPEGFEFIDDRRGYAWTGLTIHATTDAGEHWHELSRMKDFAMGARTEFVGADGAFYFIRSRDDRQVFGIDPWQGTERAIPLPDGFEPRKLSVAPADNCLFILGRVREQWKLIVLEDHRMTGMSDVPADSEWRPEVFLHDHGVLNLICSGEQLAIWRRYHFLALDEQGWDMQSLSGKTSFYQFEFAGTCAWATRTSLLSGTWEVWQRTGEDETRQTSGACQNWGSFLDPAYAGNPPAAGS